MLLKCCTLHTSKFGKLNSGQSLEKVSFHPNEKAMPKKGNAKEGSNYCTIALISHAIKVMLKILQARFIRQKNKISNCQQPLDHRKSKGIPKIKSTYASLTMQKLLSVWITTNCGKFLKR